MSNEIAKGIGITDLVVAFSQGAQGNVVALDVMNLLLKLMRVT